VSRVDAAAQRLDGAVFPAAGSDATPAGATVAAIAGVHHERIFFT
jgi:hypothetical protein